MPRKKKTASSTSLWPPKIGIFGLRIFVGSLFLRAFYYKVIGPGLPLGRTLERFVEEEYVPQIEMGIANPPSVFGIELGFYPWFLENVMMPPRYVIGPGILLAELLLGVSLVLGVGVRLSAALGALMTCCFALTKPFELLTVRSQTWLLTMCLLTLSLVAAGRIWGFDSRLKNRFPGWIS